MFGPEGMLRYHIHALCGRGGMDQHARRQAGGEVCAEAVHVVAGAGQSVFEWVTSLLLLCQGDRRQHAGHVQHVVPVR